MTHLLITSIAAAFLAGLLALPFTFPSAGHAASHPRLDPDEPGAP